METLLQRPDDTQKIELLGRNRLIDELLRDDLEVALPVRDRGIDLIAYLDLADGLSSYASRPIQMKAAWTRGFSVDRKYEKFPGLILAYVWSLCNANEAVTYALDYEEAVGIAGEMGWTETASWQQGRYSVSNPSPKLIALLEPFRMTQGKWRALLLQNRPTP